MTTRYFLSRAAFVYTCGMKNHTNWHREKSAIYFLSIDTGTANKRENEGVRPDLICAILRRIEDVSHGHE